MQLIKPGARLRSAVSNVEMIVTKAPATEVELCCGGAAMIGIDDAAQVVAGLEGKVDMGKRYVDAAGSIELLCTKPGEGGLTLNGEALAIRGSKALPSSD